MKVAIVRGDDAYSEHGGYGIADDDGQLCAALARQGLTVTSCRRRRDEDSPVEAGYRQESTGIGPATTVSPAEVLPFVGEWAAELGRQWAADPPDIVHAHGWLGGLAAQLAARRGGLPVVQSFHGIAAGTADVEKSRLLPLLVRGATWVTGGSTDEIAALARLRRRRAQVSVLSTGIDVTRYVPTGPPDTNPGSFRILQLAPNLLRHNGFELTIRALLRLSGTELVIAQTTSSADGKPALQQLAAELGVSDRVRFVDAVDQQAISSLLQSADVLTCTPWYAPRATAALQAMASGVVVVGVPVGALVDTVINGVTGVLVSPASPHELASALKALQHHTFQRVSMGSAGRSRVVSRFSWDRIAMDAVSIYHQALSHQRVTAGRGHVNATA